jgi:hypothetical protein
MTVRFQLMAAPGASAVAVLFAVIGLAIAWKRMTSSIAWIVTLAGLVTTVALFRQTHDLRSCVAATLAIAVAVEVSACRDHWIGLRWIVAMAADIVVLMLTWLGSRPPYPGQVVEVGSGTVLAGQIALLTIYLASTVDRTIFRGLRISGFEIGQLAVAFLISIGGALYAVGAGGAGTLAVGAFCLLGGAASYVVSFAFVKADGKSDRNFYTYSTFALLLVMAGLRVLVSGAALAGLAAVLAVAATVLGYTRERVTLRVHGAAYLALAIFSAGLVPLALGQIVRRAAAPEHLGAGYLAAMLGTAACYWVIVALGRERQRAVDRVEAVAVAALAVWGAAGLAAEGLSVLVSPAAQLRTALLTVLAAGLAWAGAKWDRIELDRIAWLFAAITGLKLLAEDVGQSQSHSLMVSLVLFGGGLILLPRLGRARKK